MYMLDIVDQLNDDFENDFSRRELGNQSRHFYGGISPNSYDCYGKYVIVQSHDNGQYYIDRLILSMDGHASFRKYGLDLNVPETNSYYNNNSDFNPPPYLVREDVQKNQYSLLLYNYYILYKDKHQERIDYFRLNWKQLQAPYLLKSHIGINDIKRGIEPESKFRYKRGSYNKNKEVLDVNEAYEKLPYIRGKYKKQNKKM